MHLTAGKSLAFLCFLFFSHIVGITSKLQNEAYMASFSTMWYVLIFYILNFLMAGADLLMYIRNKRLDKQAAATQTATPASKSGQRVKNRQMQKMHLPVF